MKNIVNRALVAKKKQFQSKSVPRGTRTIWRYLGALFILFTFAIGNVRAELTAHTPGVYEKTTDKGGYGCTLTTVASGTNAGTFEVYYFSALSKYSSTTTVYGGGGKQQYRLMCADSDSEYQLINRSGTGTFTASCDWIEMAYTTTGFSKSDYTFSSAYNEFFAIAPNGGNTDITKTCYIKPKNGDVLTLKVSGYVEFAILGSDNGSSKYMTVTVDGGTPTSWKSNTLSRRSVALTTGEHTIVVANVGTSANAFYGFSLKLPSCAAGAPGNISKGTLSDGVLTLNAAGSAASGDTWYWQSSATGTDKTNSGSSFDVSAADTYYIRSYNTADECWSNAKSITISATDLVANYTVKYMDGTTEVGSEVVEVGEHPTGSEITDPTKDCYTFAGWSPALSTVSGSDGDVVNVNATWTGNYFTTSVDFEKDGESAVSGIASKNIVASNAGSYDGGKVEENWAYKGWKIKSAGATVKVLVPANKKLTFKFGYLATTAHVAISGDATNYSVTGASNEEDNPLKYTTYSWVKNYDALYTFTTGDKNAAVIKALTVQDTYTATRVDAKSDGAGSDPNVLETTLPTPTAISGWTFTGWVADQDVKAGEDTKTAETVLAAGTYTLLANTTFTAQWAEASSTYDITYVSAHGTAPADDNAASVVLAELSEDGWAHKGWTANVDVTVDAATVEAGTLIANGKTVILASNVTFTAVWKEIFTVTFNSKGGSAVDPIDVEDGASIAAAPADPTKDDYVFQGWSETDGGAVVADITALTISGDKTLYAKWKLDVQVSEIVFSNSFKGWIHDSQVEVFYMEGESAPTITSYAGKNLKAEGGVVISGDKIIATGTDDSKIEFALTMTEVTPLSATGTQTFEGTEGYVKTRHAWTAERKWKMSRYAEDGRVAKGETSMYIFLGAAESLTLDWGAQKVKDDVAVYVNGTFVKNIGKNNNSAIELSNGKNMVALYSLQTSGDIWLDGLTVAPWVPVTAVTLKEGEDAISSKEIWASTSFTLTAEVTPDNASNKTITWTSSNEAVATVENGVVTGVAASADPVTITASTVDGVTATCTVTVTTAPSPCETPTVNTQPAGSAYCAGSEPTLTVVAEVSDEGTLHYAWFKVGETDEAVGSDAASYTVEAAGTYYVIVTNKKDGKLDASVTSANAVVTLNVAAAITAQPTGKSEVVSGSEVTLSVVATNATGYQWYICDDAEKHNASAISGAEAANYVFNCTANGYYYCVVGNACGADIESNVVLVKLEPEGCNMIASVPASEPYQYEQTGEWTLYGIDSNGRLNSSSKFVNNAKDFDDNTVNAIADQRVGIIFEKDVESLTLYATSSSTGRTWKSDQQIRVTSDDITSGSPVYTNVTATREVATMPGNTKQYVFSANGMIIPAGKKVWLPFSGNINIFKICYSAALAEPVLPTLSDQELCAGAAYETFNATITNAAACEGTVSYKWYSTNDTENPVAETAEFTPTAEGTYYVVVTHVKAGHISRVAQSANLTVAHFDALTLVSNSGDVFQHMGTAATLSVVATGKNVAYVWYTCSNAAGDDAVAITPAETESSLAIASVAEGVQYYKVVISHDCDATTLSHVFKVEGWNQLEQVDVTATTTWDMTNVSANHIELTGDDKNARLLLANIDGVNNTTFNAQALKFEGQHIGRTDKSVKHLAGRYLQFNVTVPGAVFVTFASNGDNARTIAINGKKCARTTSGTAADKYITYALAVEPGSVEIIGYEGESANQYVRISKIEFKAEDNHHRPVNPAYLGTLCWTNNAVLGGATLYEFAGKNEYNYLVFDEVPENRLEAGKPYIFMPENGNTLIKVYNTDNEEPKGESDLQPVNHMYGTVEGKTLVPGQDDNMYYFSASHIWAVKDFTVNIDVPAYYCYIDYPAVLAAEPAPSNPAPGRRRVTMGVQGQQVATGIEDVQGDKVQCTKMLINGQLFILRGEKMYDAKGQLVK